MPSHDELEEVCQRIGAQLEEIAKGRTAGMVSEESFVNLILMLEEEQMAPHGFTLSASSSVEGWVTIQVRIQGERKACAAFEFLPGTGEFRRLVSPCAEA